MCFHRQHGVAVEGGEGHTVAGVAQVFDYALQIFADGLYLVVGAILEEHFDEVGRRLEVVVGGIVGYPRAYAAQRFRVARVVGSVYDDLLAANVAMNAQSKQAHEEEAVGINVEHRRVFVGLVGDEDGCRDEHGGRQSLAKPYCPRALARHSVARVVENVEDDVDHDGHNDRHAEATLADNRAQGCSDEEENDADERQRELVDVLNLVLPDVLVGIACNHALELQVAQLGLHGAQSPVHDRAPRVGSQSGIEGVDVRGLLCGLCPCLFRLVRAEWFGGVVEVARIVVVHSANAVVRLVERINVGLDLLEALGARVSCNAGGLGEVEVAVEVHDEPLVYECLAAIGHGRAARKFLGAHVLKPFAAVEVHDEVLLLCRGLQHARVGKDNGLVLVAAGHAVDHDIVEFARLHVLLAHVDVGLRNAIIEHALRYFQLRAFLFHRQHELRELELGMGGNVVLEVEGHKGDENADHDKPAHRLQQGDTCGLDGRKLAALAQVAEGDERAKQDGERQSLRHHDEGHVPEELPQDIHRQALAYQLVDKSPQKLHHQHEEADEERSSEQLPELPGYEQV